MKKYICSILLCAAAVAGADNIFPLADFSKDADGFGGAFKHKTENGRGFVVLENIDQRWVDGAKNFDVAIKYEVAAFQFYARSENAERIGVRFKDSSGQEFLHRVAVKPDGQWQLIEIADLAKANESWGGANDKIFHPQIKAVCFVLEHKGTIAIDKVALKLSDKPFIPDLAWDLPLGHIFGAAADVAIPIRSSRASIDWEVTDFWHDTVDKGTVKPANGVASIKPAIKNPGYYLLKLGDDKFVSFALVPAFEPKDRANSPFGVMTHFAQHMEMDILPLLSRIGIVSIRDEHYWANVEKTKGKYEFSEKSDAYMAAAKANKIDPLIAMTFNNPNHDDDNAPYTPAGCDAYGDYGVSILKQYGSQIKWLEVWNEYNGSWCKGPASQDRPKYYAQMVKHAYEKIKAARPDVKVLGCATVVIPLPYLEGIFKHGGLKYMDAVVLHPYRGSPEGVEVEVAQVEALIRQYNDGEDKPIWITETGTYSRTEFDWEQEKKMYEQGRQKVARYLARQYSLLLTCNVEKIHWYLCRDYMEFITMGLLRNVDDPMGRYAVAPAYVAYANLIKQLDGAKFVRRADLGKYTYALLFDTNNGPVWVCWATQPATIAFNADGARDVVDIMGVSRKMSPAGGQIFLSLGEDAVYFRGKGEPVNSSIIAADLRCPVNGAPTFVAGEKFAGFTLATSGKNITLDANGNARLPLETTAPKTEFSQYGLFKGNDIVAMGTLRHEVVESVFFLPETIRAESATTLFAQLENRLPDTPAYQFRGADWKINGKTYSTRNRAAFPAGNVISLRFDDLDEALEPFKKYDLEITARFDGRANAVWRGSVAYNPCVKGETRVIDMDKHAQRWGADAKCGVKIEVSHNGDELLFNCSDTTKKVTIGLSYPEVGNMVLVDPKARNRKIPAPKNADTFRMAIVVEDDKTVWEWGTGIFMGKTPEGFNVCAMWDGSPDPSTVNLPAFEISEIKRTVRETRPALGRVLADSETDYTKEQGGNNHWYGYYKFKQFDADAFAEMEHVQTIWGYNWAPKEGGYPHMNLSATVAHPGVRDGFPVWSVRRWKSDYSGKAQISGTFRVNDERSDGVGLRVLVDGVQVASYLSGGAGRPRDVPFEFTVELKAGSLVDFAFTPGPAAQLDYDATSYNFIIKAK
ncbi:MAG: hypothetical protein FWG05_03940 [Kiritimatiellaeota bacterium]|nr:hypothetical protein [Kiritimatiellota bacterium]